MSNMTAEEILARRNDYTFDQYDHGGSRIYIDGESGERQLLVDTYYDKEFAEYIDRCVQAYFYGC